MKRLFGLGILAISTVAFGAEDCPELLKQLRNQNFWAKLPPVPEEATHRSSLSELYVGGEFRFEDQPLTFRLEAILDVDRLVPDLHYSTPVTEAQIRDFFKSTPNITLVDNTFGAFPIEQVPGAAELSFQAVGFKQLPWTQTEMLQNQRFSEFLFSNDSLEYKIVRDSQEASGWRLHSYGQVPKAKVLFQKPKLNLRAIQKKFPPGSEVQLSHTNFRVLAYEQQGADIAVRVERHEILLAPPEMQGAEAGAVVRQNKRNYAIVPIEFYNRTRKYLVRKTEHSVPLNRFVKSAQKVESLPYLKQGPASTEDFKAGLARIFGWKADPELLPRRAVKDIQLVESRARPLTFLDSTPASSFASIRKAYKESKFYARTDSDYSWRPYNPEQSPKLQPQEILFVGDHIPHRFRKITEGAYKPVIHEAGYEYTFEIPLVGKKHLIKVQVPKGASLAADKKRLEEITQLFGRQHQGLEGLAEHARFHSAPESGGQARARVRHTNIDKRKFELEFYADPKKRDSDEEALWHETGHLEAYNRTGTNIPNDYLNIMLAEKKAITPYAMSAPSEDYAETFYHYVKSDAGTRNPKLRQEFPLRFAYWDALFGVSPEQLALAQAYYTSLFRRKLALYSGSAATSAVLLYLKHKQEQASDSSPTTPDSP
jgi:hypothetical protein